LSGANSYTGGTTISGGTLAVASNAALGATSGGVALSGGSLMATASFTSDRAIALSGAANGIDVNHAADTLTLSGDMTGSGAVTKTGSGTLHLIGSNSYSGGTTISGGLLKGDTASLFGDIVNNAALTFAQASDGVFSGAVSGSGTLTKSGAGSLTLAGTNSYSGGTRVEEGTLIGSSTSLQGAIVNAAAVTFNQTSDGSYAGAMSGSGTLIKSGAGTLTLTGSNSYTGGTTVSAGGLIGDSASLQGAITNTAAVTFNQTADGTYAGAMSGSGTLTKSGAGTLTLTGTNSYTGGTTVSAGALVGDSASLQGAIANDAAVTFNQASDGTYAGSMSGTGTLTKSGAGTLTLTGSNSYTGGTTVSGGALVGNTASLQGAIVNTASVTFNQASDGTYAGVMSGTGTLTKSGAGSLTLADTNSVSTVTIAEGTLRIGTGGTSGWVSGAITNNAALVYDLSTSYELPTTLSGTGSLTLTGGGTASFAGASGFTGAVSVENASLVLSSGSTSGSEVTVAQDGTLSGTGTIAGLVMKSGGRVSPGYSPGTLSVSGNVSFASGSLYRVEVYSSGAHDLISATGTASLLGGTVEVVAQSGYQIPTASYTILSAAGGLSGQFDSVTANFAYLTPSLSYDAMNVYLTLQRNDIQFAESATTPNTTAVATAAQALGYGNPLYDALVMLTPAQADAAFKSLSGEIYASASEVMLQQSSYLRGSVGSRLRQSFGDGPAAGGPTTAALASGFEPTTLWVNGYGAWGNAWGDGNASSVSQSFSGFHAGADALVWGPVRVGVFGGYGQSSLSAPGVTSSGTIGTYDIGLYAGANFDHLRLSGGLSYSWQDVSMQRSVAFPGFSGASAASYMSGTAQLFAEAGYQFAQGSTVIEPFAGVAYVNLDNGRFTETGSAAALMGQAEGEQLVYGTLGVRGATRVLVPGLGWVKPSASLAWQHAFGETSTGATLAFASGSPSFTVDGVPVAQDSALVEPRVRLSVLGSAERRGVLHRTVRNQRHQQPVSGIRERQVLMRHSHRNTGRLRKEEGAS